MVLHQRYASTLRVSLREIATRRCYTLDCSAMSIRDQSPRETIADLWLNQDSHNDYAATPAIPA